MTLTRKGRSRLAAARPLWSGAQARFEDSFGKRKAADLRAVLLNIVREPAFVADDATPSSGPTSTSIHAAGDGQVSRQFFDPLTELILCSCTRRPDRRAR